MTTKAFTVITTTIAMRRMYRLGFLAALFVVRIDGWAVVRPTLRPPSTLRPLANPWSTTSLGLFKNNEPESPSSSDSSTTSLSTLTESLFEDVQSLTAPVQSLLDDYTGGWALSYADLSPETPSTPGGQAFLATNLAYFLAGLLLWWQGEGLLGFLTDLASICSFNYHYNQLREDQRLPEVQSAVRLSLLLDYTAAGMSLLTAFGYLAVAAWNHQELSAEVALALQVGLVGFGFLFLCWRWEKGYPYMVFHSMWHFCSAAAGYLIGTTHLQAQGVVVEDWSHWLG